jgi:hypothetical protein
MTRTAAMIDAENSARAAALDRGHRLGRFVSDPMRPGARDAFCVRCGRHVEYQTESPLLRGQVLLTRCPVPIEGVQ